MTAIWRDFMKTKSFNEFLKQKLAKKTVEKIERLGRVEYKKLSGLQKNLDKKPRAIFE